jgi:hypothetical protein
LLCHTVPQNFIYASTVLASLYDVFDNGRLTREEAELGFVHLLAQSISYKPTRADRERLQIVQ